MCRRGHSPLWIKGLAWLLRVNLGGRCVLDIELEYWPEGIKGQLECG
jgi:hypothetical protein